jgi:hypothetical protein
MKKKVFIQKDGELEMNIIDWDDGNNLLNFNIYDNEDESSSGFIFNVKQVKELIKVLQRWVEK